MSWINGYERKKFEAKMKKQAEEYRAVGMTEEQIQQIQEFDLAQFNSDRRYYEHTQEFPDSSFDDGDGDEGQSPLYERFRELLTVSIEVYDDGSRYGWVETIENPKLYRCVKQLSQEQLELITLQVFDGLKRSEIAKSMGISASAVTQRFQTIEKIFEKFFAQP